MSQDTTPFRLFAVLGPWRGGTSLVTGVLQALGAYVGDEFVDAETNYCTYEDVALRQACVQGFDERPGTWNYKGTSEYRITMLREWLDQVCLRAKSANAVAIAAKHPILCKLVDDMFHAWSVPNQVELTVVSVIRPAEAVHRSWTRPINASGNHWWPRWDRIYVVDDLIGSRDRALADRPHVQIDFATLRDSPAETIRQLATDCELPIDQLDQAIAMVRT